MLLILVYLLFWSKFATQENLKSKKLINFVSLNDIFLRLVYIAQYCFAYFFNDNEVWISTVFLFVSCKSRFHVALYLLALWANDPFCVMKVLPSEQILNTLCIHIFKLNELDGKCEYIPFKCKSFVKGTFFI